MTRPVFIVAALIVIALAGAGCGDDESSTPTPSVTQSTTATTVAEEDVKRPPKPDITVVVAGTTISGGGRKTAELGKPLRIQVIADVKDEVHLHGYDKLVNVAAGKPATIAFTPDIPGVFEVELESKGLKLLDLVVK